MKLLSYLKMKFAVPLVFVLVFVSLFGCGKGNAYENGELYVYNWGEYIDPEVIEMFEKEYGIKVIYDMFETNEEMYPIIEMGTVNYDVVCPSDYMITKMKDNNLLLPINKELIPNLKNIEEDQMEIIKQVDEGNNYTVPYMVGTVGILYNETILNEKNLPAPRKWADIFTDTYKGELLMINSSRDAMLVGLKKNGFSANSVNPAELDKAIEDLKNQKQYVQAYVVDQAKDKMIGGEAAVAVVYSGDILYVLNESDNDEYVFKYVLPEEGTNVWIDAWVIPKTAKNIDNANKWMDFMCRPDIAKLNSEFIGYETPNREAKKLLSDEHILTPPTLIDLTNNNNEIFVYLGVKGEEEYNERWKELKSE